MVANRPPQQDVGEQGTLLEFPCEFGVKAMGRDEGDFEQRVTGIILSHAKRYAGTQNTINRSGGGKFIAVTVTIEALSKAQLDQIYQELSNCEQVLVTL